MIGPETTRSLQSYGVSPNIFHQSYFNLVYRLLPDWLPFHPHRWWIHVRTVYVPMSYLYGVRFKMEENDLILSLRQVITCLA
jgi:hypothetical protein